MNTAPGADLGFKEAGLELTTAEGGGGGAGGVRGNASQENFENRSSEMRFPAF